MSDLDHEENVQNQMSCALKELGAYTRMIHMMIIEKQ
jgi:hypothetical protein